MKKSKGKTKTTTAVELLEKGIGSKRPKKGTVLLDKTAEEYEIIKNMKLSDLVERLIDSMSTGRKDLSITENRIDLMTKVVKNAILVMHRNGAKELSVKIKGDLIEMSFNCQADNICLSGPAYIYPYMVDCKLSKSNKKVTVNIKDVK